MKNIPYFRTEIDKISSPLFRPKSLKHHIQVQQNRFCSASKETEQSEAPQSSQSNLINHKLNPKILQWVKPESKVLRQISVYGFRISFLAFRSPRSSIIHIISSIMLYFDGFICLYIRNKERYCPLYFSDIL